MSPFVAGSRVEKAVALLGRFGFATKALVYGGIGVLACVSALSRPQNESPQGVFILAASQRGIRGELLLVMLLLGLASYVCWRFWEGLYGSAARCSAAKSFFTYRLAPLVSGVVYLVYALYVAFLLVESARHAGISSTASAGSCFPACWRDSAPGFAALLLLALAFAIGAITQLQPAVTASFDRELDAGRIARVSRLVVVSLRWGGRIGFLARGALFASVAAYLFRAALGEPVALAPTQNTVARALNELRLGAAGRALLLIVGAGLVVYGIFAALNVHFRAFPTPPPSRKP